MMPGLVSWIQAGGFVMVPLVAAAMALWYALGYRMLTLRRGNRRSVRILIERYRTGYDRVPAGIVDSAVVCGLDTIRLGGANLRRRLDSAFSDFEREINRFGVLVSALVGAAPLAGLLGTVSGMIETFDSLADMSLFSQSGGIAGGISEALISTQMGLVVAIPGLLVGRVLDRRQAVLQMELDRLKDILCAEAEPAKETGA